MKCILHIEKNKVKEHDHVEKGKKNKEKLKWRSKHSKGADPDFRGERVQYASTKATEELSFVRYLPLSFCDIFAAPSFCSWITNLVSTVVLLTKTELTQATAQIQGPGR